VHQFVRIGRHAMLGGASGVDRDVPPFALAAGNRVRLYGLNRRGLSRAGMSAPALRALQHAYQRLFRSGLRLEVALEELRDNDAVTDEVAHLLAFLSAPGRGPVR
jgi:UDP-N-acetylglucosamine acyltransferase